MGEKVVRAPEMVDTPEQLEAIYGFVEEEDVLDIRVVLGVVGEDGGKPSMRVIVGPNSEVLYDVGRVVETGERTNYIRLIATPTQRLRILAGANTLNNKRRENIKRRKVLKASKT